MFRSVVATLCRFRGCLPHLPQGLDNGVAAIESCRPLHLTACRQVLDKDHPAKRNLKKGRSEQELSAVAEDADEQMQGLKFDSMFPTLETHSMLINNTRFDELPIVHIKATHNNTVVMVTDGKGVPLAHESGGTVGFRNARKGTNIAAQAAAIALAQKATKKGINLIRVSVKGIGPGRLPAIKGLQMSGLTLVSITDSTPLPHNGLRPKKQRRV